MDPWRYRSANLITEKYPPRDQPLSECQLTLPRTRYGYFNKNCVIFMLNFSIILLILALTSHIMFCQHDNLMSTIKINNRKIRLKMLKRFYCEAKLFQLSCMYIYTYTHVHI